jgi:Spy/CpxP family protein refolding chaperone
MNDRTTLDPADETPLAPPARSTRLLAAGVLVVVALAGMLGGIALDRTVLHPRGWAVRSGPPRGERGVAPRRPSAMLPPELKLTEAQAVRIDTLVDRQMQGFREIRKSTQPAIDSLMAQTKRSMDSILTPVQRAQLDSTRATRQSEFGRRSPDGAPSRGGPPRGGPPHLGPGERMRMPEPRP